MLSRRKDIDDNNDFGGHDRLSSCSHETSNTRMDGGLQRLEAVITQTLEYFNPVAAFNVSLTAFAKKTLVKVIEERCHEVTDQIV